MPQSKFRRLKVHRVRGAQDKYAWFFMSAQADNRASKARSLDRGLKHSTYLQNFLIRPPKHAPGLRFFY